MSEGFAISPVNKPVNLQAESLDLSRLMMQQMTAQGKALASASINNGKMLAGQQIQQMNFEANRSLANLESKRLLNGLAGKIKLISTIQRDLG